MPKFNLGDCQKFKLNLILKVTRIPLPIFLGKKMAWHRIDCIMDLFNKTKNESPWNILEFLNKNVISVSDTYIREKNSVGTINTSNVLLEPLYQRL